MKTKNDEPTHSCSEDYVECPICKGKTSWRDAKSESNDTIKCIHCNYCIYCDHGAKTTQTWYSEALEVLTPLRWHLDELVGAIEEYNGLARKINLRVIPEKKVVAAKEAMDKANRFFLGKSKI